jgi:deoxyribodipyrimidine photo-lyase
MKTYQLALHIFRRDLRLQDNTALIAALKSSEQVLPCFIFDKRQIEHNDFKSDHCIQFMTKSLAELAAALRKKQSKLYFFYGIAEQMVSHLLEKIAIQAIFINRDYTPFSMQRDQKIEKICRARGVDFHRYDDALLHEPEQIKKTNGEPYTIFTPYFHTAKQIAVRAPSKNANENYYRDNSAFVDDHT